MKRVFSSFPSLCSGGLFALIALAAPGCSSDPGGSEGDGDGDGDGDTSGVGGGFIDGSSGGTLGDGDGDLPSGGFVGTGSAPGTGGEGANGTGGDGGAPKRTFLYVGSGDWGDAEPGKITVFEVDRTTKALTFVSDHDAGGLASYMALDLDNNRLFAVDEKNGGVLAFTINPDTGSLTSNGSETNDRHPVYLSLTPDKNYLLGANYGEGSVDVYPINGSGQVGDSIQTVGTGQYAHCIVMDGTSRVLVANKGGDTISRFTYASGVLTPQAPPTTALGSPRHITMGPDNRAYVVSEEDDLITSYNVAGDGQLSVHWQDERLPEGGNPANDTGADIRITPNGDFLYATNRGNSNTIVAYDISGEAPSFIEHEGTQGTIPRSMAMDPRGEMLMVGNHGNQKISVYTIGGDGALTHVLTEDTTMSPFFVTLVDL